MDIVMSVLFWSVLFVLGAYGMVMIWAVISALIVYTTESLWEVDLKDPTKKKGIIRDIGPFDIVTVVRGGRPAFPVITPSAQRLSFRGLQNDVEGMRTTNEKDWVMYKVPVTEKDENGNDVEVEYKDIIQSKYGLYSPVYIFRKLVFLLTGKHVVRIKAPFFIFGFFDYYKPYTHRFERLKNISQDKVNDRPSMQVIEDIPLIGMKTVVDTSDHMLWEFPLTFATADYPTTDGYSLRIKVTLVLRVHNVNTNVSWRSWSRQIRTVVNNAVNPYIRSGSLDERYAIKNKQHNIKKDPDGKDPDGKVSIKNELVELVYNNLADAGTYCHAKDSDGKEYSAMESFGFTLQSVAIDDIFPATEEVKKAIERIMSIRYEGEKTAGAAGALIREQVKELEQVGESSKQQLAAITAAQRSKGKIDYIINQSGASVDAQTVYSKKIAQNTEPDQTKKEEGEE